MDHVEDLIADGAMAFFALDEQGGKLFVLGDVLVGGRVGADAVGQTQQIHDFFLAEV